MLYFPHYGGGNAMPLILLGVIVLIVAFIVVPLIILMFSNPLLFGGGLILLGLIWVIAPKILYGLVYCIAKPYYFWIEVVFPKLRERPWWQSLIKICNKITHTTDSIIFQRSMLYGVVFIMIALVFYFNQNPIVK